MPGFLIPAAIAAGGALLGGLSKKKAANQQSQYEYDQARRNYEAEQALKRTRKQQGLQAIDFLQGVAQAKGYNIPDSAFEALKKSHDYEDVPVDARFAKPPKQGFGNVLLGALGQGASTYGSALLGNAVDQASKYNTATAGIGTRAAADPWDDVVDYWANLGALGGDRPNGGAVPLGGRR